MFFLLWKLSKAMLSFTDYTFLFMDQEQLKMLIAFGHSLHCVSLTGKLFKLHVFFFFLLTPFVRS